MRLYLVDNCGFQRRMQIKQLVNNISKKNLFCFVYFLVKAI